MIIEKSLWDRSCLIFFLDHGIWKQDFNFKSPLDWNSKWHLWIAAAIPLLVGLLELLLELLKYCLIIIRKTRELNLSCKRQLTKESTFHWKKIQVHWMHSCNLLNFFISFLGSITFHLQLQAQQKWCMLNVAVLRWIKNLRIRDIRQPSQNPSSNLNMQKIRRLLQS